MQSGKSIFKLLLFILIISVISQTSYSQVLRDDDKVDEVTAKTRKNSFHGQFGGRRALTQSVIFDVDQLQAILDLYKNANIKQIPFVFATIRDEDGDKYVMKHRNSDKASIRNQPTLLIKGVPGASLNFLSPGVQVYYYDIGSICPPPNGACD